jgi:hypothetical protein
MERIMNRRLFVCLLLAAAPAVADWRRDHKEECARVDEKLKEIETQRRMGYTPKQGRTLEAKREKLEQKRREMCR